MFTVGSEQCRTVFKVGSLERLFTEINKKLNIHLNERNIRSGMSVREILEAGMYGHGIGCSVSYSKCLNNFKIKVMALHYVFCTK